MMKRVKSKSMSSIIIRVTIPVFLLFGIVLVIMFQSIMQARELAYRYIEDTASLNAYRANEDIRKINSEIVYLLYYENNIGKLPDDITQSDTRYYDLLDDITALNKTLKIRYGGQYFFYEYVQKSEFLIQDGLAIFPISYKEELSHKLIGMLKGYASGEEEMTEWNYIETDNGSYLFSHYENQGKSIGCVIHLKEFFSQFNINNLGYKTIPFFLTEEGDILTTGPEEKDRIQEYMKGDGRRGPLSQDTLLSYPLGRVGDVKLLVYQAEDILGRIMFFQILSIAFTAGIILLTGLVAFTYYRRILSPMRQFVNRLYEPEEEKWLHDMENHGILELEMASREFRQLFREIQSLKIAVYEKEIQQKQTQLEYLQEQIKPHFYLNCLSIIHGRAESIQAEDIMEITSRLSDYMRYVVNDSFVLREVGREIDHVMDYIQIQKFRYGDSFSFEVIMDDSLRDCPIPPLMLQVFAENSLQHAVSLDVRVEITLYLEIEQHEDGEYLYICLSDTGKGFSEDILEKIGKGKEIEYGGRKHIGLQNVRKRLDFLYQGRAELKLSNMRAGYGGVVEVTLPARGIGKGGSY